VLGLSQTCGYAILALSCLHECGDRWVLACDIARCTGVPLPYLSKLLHSLVRCGLVVAKRGYRGGFALARPPADISVLDIAEAVDGEQAVPRCLLGLAECSPERACPTHQFWQRERERIISELRRLTLAETARFERRDGTRLGSCPPRDSRRLSRRRAARTATVNSRSRRRDGENRT